MNYFLTQGAICLLLIWYLQKNLLSYGAGLRAYQNFCVVRTAFRSGAAAIYILLEHDHGKQTNISAWLSECATRATPLALAMPLAPSRSEYNTTVRYFCFKLYLFPPPLPLDTFKIMLPLFAPLDVVELAVIGRTRHQGPQRQVVWSEIRTPYALGPRLLPGLHAGKG